MNSKVEPASFEDLLSLFENVLSPEDVLSSKAMAQASKAIIHERLNLQMSQKEFAEHIHATQSLVSRWERGDYNFSIRKLACIATALDMNLHIYMTPVKRKSEEFTPCEKIFTKQWNNLKIYGYNLHSSPLMPRHNAACFSKTIYVNEVISND